MRTLLLNFLLLFSITFQSKNTINPSDNKFMIDDTTKEVAIFAGGCFWCTEAVFLQLEGVESIKPGYIGGNIENPTYEEVCTGKTGHAEAIKIVFDPSKITYEDLLQVFFATHDPTTLNRQGADVGSQYRSEIFTTNEKQKKSAWSYIKQLNEQKIYPKKVVTVVSNAPTFYVAEDYHLNYYNRNKNKSYCHYVITPKVNKVREKFKTKLKK
jgi:peptide-methionine (S)-S-oxide reductase